jgi:hypothetical protein
VEPGICPGNLFAENPDSYEPASNAERNMLQVLTQPGNEAKAVPIAAVSPKSPV